MTQYGIFESYMGRIALDVQEKSDSPKECEKINMELSEFWQTGDESKLSPKAKEIWLAWKKENKRKSDTNKTLVNEWEGA